MIKSDLTYKIIIAGDASVGKTTLLRRYVENFFVELSQMTVGVEIHKKTLKINKGLICDLQLWDFGGQERFRFFLDSFVLGANGALLLFDMTRHYTLDKIGDWVKIARKYDPNLPILFIGTKMDLKDFVSVTDEEILELKAKYGFIDYIKVSSKTGYNVNETFSVLTEFLFNRQKIEKKIGIEAS